MTDRVRMTSRTVFASDRITVFAEGGPPEGVLGGAVSTGQEFETDLAHAKDLDRLGHAEPLNRADLDGDLPPLEPSYQVSVPALQADQAARTGTAEPLPAASTTFASAGPADPATDGRPAEATEDEPSAGTATEEVPVASARRRTKD